MIETTKVPSAKSKKLPKKINIASTSSPKRKAAEEITGDKLKLTKKNVSKQDENNNLRVTRSSLNGESSSSRENLDWASETENISNNPSNLSPGAYLMNSPGSLSPKPNAGETCYVGINKTSPYGNIFPRKIPPGTIQPQTIQKHAPENNGIEDNLEYEINKIREQEGFNTDSEANDPLSDEEIDNENSMNIKEIDNVVNVIEQEIAAKQCADHHQVQAQHSDIVNAAGSTSFNQGNGTTTTTINQQQILPNPNANDHDESYEHENGNSYTLFIRPIDYPNTVITSKQRFDIIERLDRLASLQKEVSGIDTSPSAGTDHKSGAIIVIVDNEPASRWIKFIVKTDWKEIIPFNLTADEDPNLTLAPAFNLWSPKANSSFEETCAATGWVTTTWRVIRESRGNTSASGKNFRIIALNLSRYFEQNDLYEFNMGFSVRRGNIRSIDKPREMAQDSRRNKRQGIDEEANQKRLQLEADMDMIRRAQEFLGILPQQNMES